MLSVNDGPADSGEQNHPPPQIDEAEGLLRSRHDRRDRICHKFSLLLQAALPLGRRLRRRLGRAFGAFGASSVNEPEHGASNTQGAEMASRPAAGRPATSIVEVLEESRRSPQGSAPPAFGRP